MVGAQSDSVQVVTLVEDEHAEGVMVDWVGERDTGGADGVGKAKVDDQVRVLDVGLLADIGGADTQNMAIIKQSPKEGLWGVVVFPVVEAGGSCEMLGAVGTLIVDRSIGGVMAISVFGATIRWRRHANFDERGSRGGLEADAGFLMRDAQLRIHLDSTAASSVAERQVCRGGEWCCCKNTAG